MEERSKISGIDDTLAAEGSSDARVTDGRPSFASSGGHGLIAGRYEIQALLGVGGMGCVYRARDRDLDEVVALKVLRRELVDNPGMLLRFRQEVKLARRVTHRGVARTFDIGEHDGERFLTMEYIDGETLAAVVERAGMLSIERVIAIGCDLCAAMSAAHEAGIVHRDLKPDNVMLAKDGRVVITDFGIARVHLDAGVSRTSEGVVGTPAYMAPEQVEAASDIDHRADLYALGALLYELFTGARAWPGESPFSVAAARLVAAPPDPRVIRSGLPAALGDIVLRLLARRREDRFQHAGDVAAALTAARVELSARATEPPPPTTTVLAPSPIPALAARDMTVAVLPFRNAGPAEDEYVADGLTEDLIDTLSMVRGLRVRPRATVMRLKGKDADPRELGRELAVEVVIEGSVRRVGTSYRLSARMTSVADGFQLWARRFDRPSGDMLVVNDEVAQAIADALRGDVLAPVRAAPTDPLAIDLYLRARFEMREAWHSRAGIEGAVARFEQALARAPSDPSILAGNAVARARLAFYGGAGAEEAIRSAREAAERAIAAAPHLGEAWVALASVKLVAIDPAGAGRALKTAIEKAPRLAKAHELLGRLLLEIGAADDAIKHLETALALDPATLEPRWDLSRAHALLGHWTRAEALIELPVDDAASRTAINGMRARFGVWRARELPRAPAPVIDDTRSDGVPRMMLRLCRSVLHEGTLPEDEMRQYEAIVASLPPVSRIRSLMLQYHAEVVLAAGDEERAMVSVRAAVEAGLTDILWMERCPLLQALRARAGWRALAATVAARARAIVTAL